MSTARYLYAIAILAFVFLSLFSNKIFASDGLPLIKRYSVENYQAGIENWAAVQGNSGMMYFANSEGILEYDGLHWRLIRTAGGSAIRSLSKSPDGTIYVAADDDLGYLTQDKNGQKQFRSLVAKVPEKYRKYLSHVWKVETDHKFRYFLAGGALLIFNAKNEFVKILDSSIYLRSLFIIDKKIYAYSNEHGILLLNPTTQQFEVYCDHSSVLNLSLEFISKHPNGGLRIHIFDKGFFRIDNQKIIAEKQTKGSSFDTDYIFCQEQEGGLLFLGTTTNGLYVLKKNSLEIINHYDKKLGLNDNKIFAVYADEDKNIWLCHENGISYIEINSQVRMLNENLGISGAGKCTGVFKNNLFVGTSYGLFVSKPKTYSDFYSFQLFEDIKQPSFFLENKGDHLLIGCLHDIFEYNGSKLKSISSSNNNHKIKAFKDNKDQYLVSNSSGFMLLEYNHGFKVLNTIAGLNSEVLNFEIDLKGNIWFINNKHELIQAVLGKDKKAFIQQVNFSKKYKDLKILSLSIFDNLLFFGTDNGLWFYDEAQNKLQRLEMEVGANSKKYVTNWIYNQNDEDLWYEKTYYEDGKLHYNIDILSESNLGSEPNSLNSLIYGNMAFSFGKFSPTELAIGTSEGFLIFKPDLNYDSKPLVKSYIRRIAVTDAKDSTYLNGIWTEAGNHFNLSLNQEATTIEIACSANFFDSKGKVYYSYRLEGLEDEWKPWTTSNMARYTLSGDGDYTFQVRATNNFITVSKITSYTFRIEKPWYKTIWFYTLEIVVLLFVMVISVYLNRKGSSKISKISAFTIVLVILTFFESFSELLQGWIDAQGVSIFAIKIAINILIALSISPIESYIRKKLIKPIKKF